MKREPNHPAALVTRLATLRDPIEHSFGRFGHWIYRRAGYTILAVSLVVATLCTQLGRIEFETSTEEMFKRDDPVRLTYEDFRERYGRDQAILVAIETDDVFDQVFLERLRALHEELEAELPHLQDVESLINIRSTRGEGDELIVEDLLEEWPQSRADLERLRRRVHANPLYVDQVISHDDRVTMLIVRPNVYSLADPTSEPEDLLSQFQDPGETGGLEEEPVYLSGEENTQIVLATQAIAARHERDDFTIMIAGLPVMVERILNVMSADMARFTGLALFTIAVLLALVFRRFGAVVLPLLVSSLAMVCTMSAMAIIGIPLTTVTQIMPSFLLAIGVGSAVHILSIYYQATSRGESREDSIAFALEHSGLAVVMTSLTTAGGMLSFTTASLTHLSDLGIITPIGILIALVFSLVLLPALIAFMPIKGGIVAENEISGTRRILMRIGDYATRHAVVVLAVWSVILGVSVMGALRLEVSHDSIAWFPEDDPLRIAMETLNDRLNGTMFIEAVVSTGEENKIQSPELLRRIEEFESFAKGLSTESVYVGKTISITDVIQETHQALNENREEFYAIPEDPQLVAQELLLFESGGSDDLEKLVDSQFSQARITLKIPFADGVEYAPFMAQLEKGAERILGDEVEIVFTGEARMMAAIVGTLIFNLIKTYALAFAIITPLMMLLLGSFRLGLVSMIPNLAPLVITLGIMGWFEIPLEVFTLLIGSIALGLAVDDTVHFMHNFRRYFERDGDVGRATRDTLSTTGQALLFTSIILSSGFFIYTLATMTNLFYFGLLTGITILFAFLADLVLAPALMSLLAAKMMRSRVTPKEKQDETAGVPAKPSSGELVL